MNWHSSGYSTKIFYQKKNKIISVSNLDLHRLRLLLDTIQWHYNNPMFYQRLIYLHHLTNNTTVLHYLSCLRTWRFWNARLRGWLILDNWWLIIYDVPTEIVIIFLSRIVIRRSVWQCNIIPTFACMTTDSFIFSAAIFLFFLGTVSIYWFAWLKRTDIAIFKQERTKCGNRIWNV